MGSGLTIPEELNEEECRSLAKSAGVKFDHQRFISLATERNGDPTAEASVSRSQLIVDVSKAVSSRLRNEPADVIRKPRPPKKILLPELVDAFEQAFSAGLTPLILDPSPGHNADTFFRYSHTSILDAKRVGLDAALGTGSEAQGLEEARHALVQAMKRGKTLVVSMQQSSPPFSSWLRHPDFFPAMEVFTNAGQDLVTFDSEWPDRLFRAEDMTDTHGFAIANKDFRVVLTSWFSTASDADSFLFDEDRGLAGFDRALFQLIIVENMNGESGPARGFGAGSRVQHHRDSVTPDTVGSAT